MTDTTVTQPLPSPSSPPAPIPTPTNVAASVTTTTPLDDGGASSATVLKPGATTSEFVVTMLIVLGGLLMSTPLITNNQIIQAIGLIVAFLKAAVYTWSRTSVKNGAGSVVMVLVLLFGLGHASGCASVDDKAMGATLTTTQIAYATFTAYNDAKQSKCVADAHTKAEGLECATTWWAESDKIGNMFVVVFAGISAWALLKDSPHLSTVVTAATALSNELKTAGVIK